MILEENLDGDNAKAELNTTVDTTPEEHEKQNLLSLRITLLELISSLSTKIM